MRMAFKDSREMDRLRIWEAGKDTDCLAGECTGWPEAGWYLNAGDVPSSSDIAGHG